jgi:pyruvate, orthophosphate dikinase
MRLSGVSQSTAVASLQAMVFGNMGSTSATGLAFTRNPFTGAKALYGEYLVNAQGEDVVGEQRFTNPIERMHLDLPVAYRELVRNCEILERRYRDMQVRIYDSFLNLLVFNNHV